MTANPLTVRSPAKINWCLRVLGRRHDGFHDIASLVSTITLADELVFTGRDEPGIHLVSDRDGLPSDDRNLIVRAGMLLAQAAGIVPRASCRLTKRIPVGGGLGGGSSNAAAALMAFSRLWGLYWPIDRLAPLAARLGSDVSLFLWGGSAAMTGRGEHVRPVHLHWDGWIVLLLPPFSTSTAEIYHAWRKPDRWPAPTLMDEIISGSDSSAISAERWMHAAYNMLEVPLLQLCPAMKPLLESGSRLAGRPVRVSGSGSTLFTAFDTRGEAEDFARRVREALSIGVHVAQIEQPQAALADPASRQGPQDSG